MDWLNWLDQPAVFKNFHWLMLNLLLLRIILFGFEPYPLKGLFGNRRPAPAEPTMGGDE